MGSTPCESDLDCPGSLVCLNSSTTDLRGICGCRSIHLNGDQCAIDDAHVALTVFLVAFTLLYCVAGLVLLWFTFKKLRETKDFASVEVIDRAKLCWFLMLFLIFVITHQSLFIVIYVEEYMNVVPDGQKHDLRRIASEIGVAALANMLFAVTHHPFLYVNILKSVAQDQDARENSWNNSFLWESLSVLSRTIVLVASVFFAGSASSVENWPTIFLIYLVAYYVGFTNELMINQRVRANFKATQNADISKALAKFQKEIYIGGCGLAFFTLHIFVPLTFLSFDGNDTSMKTLLIFVETTFTAAVILGSFAVLYGAWRRYDEGSAETDSKGSFGEVTEDDEDETIVVEIDYDEDDFTASFF